MSEPTHGPSFLRPAVCEDCGLNYRVKSYGDPWTVRAFTCDDCGGAVEVWAEDEIRDHLDRAAS